MSTQEELNQMQKEHDEKERSGGQVYPMSIAYQDNVGIHQGSAGITRRNKLIDDLVVGLASGFIAKDRSIFNLRENLKNITNAAIEIADATITESNK